jgi:hypothetical protein
MEPIVVVMPSLSFNCRITAANNGTNFELWMGAIQESIET